ncbi:MAG: hypothetical protein II916_01780 [Oscillospiraceae bacterium]|nr:hypothetical protein [Oscillospiraceae bacterium]
MVIAPKSDYTSLDAFLDGAFAYLESDPNFYDDWQEIYRERDGSPASEEKVQYLRSCLTEKMDQRVNMLLPPFERAVYVAPPAWNEVSLGAETRSEYLFILWATSA